MYTDHIRGYPQPWEMTRLQRKLKLLKVSVKVISLLQSYPATLIILDITKTSFNNVPVKSKLKNPLPGNPPGHLNF